MGRLFVYFALNCLILGCGFYLTQIVSVSPVYPLLAFALVLSIGVFGSRKVLVPSVSLTTRLSLCVCVLHCVAYLYFVSPLNSILGYFLNFVFAILSLWLMPYVDKPKLERLGFRLVNFTIALGGGEAMIRWFFPFQDYKQEFLEFVRESGSTFYLYKFNSIMYQDSNFVASWILVSLMFSIEYFGLKRCGFRIFVLSALLLLTICRSAILCFMLYIICKIVFNKFKTKISRIIVLTTIVMGALGGLAGLIIKDDSFQSKIAIFGLVVVNYISSLDITSFLFGVGLSNSKYVLGGITAHNFIMELLIDVGVLGLLALMLLLISLSKTSGYKGGSILAIFILSGMSFAPVTVPYLFVVLSLLGILTKGSRRLSSG